jgi:hypothetical protein
VQLLWAGPVELTCHAGRLISLPNLKLTCVMPGVPCAAMACFQALDKAFDTSTDICKALKDTQFDQQTLNKVRSRPAPTTSIDHGLPAYGCTQLSHTCSTQLHLEP